MSRTTAFILGALGVLGGSICLAQSYKCDWSVNGIGGGEMTSSAYKCGATAGQTAAGTMTGTSYQAFIGFWQIEEQVGIQEVVKWPSGQVLKTRLYSPAPNPARSRIGISYSLAAGGPVSLTIHDLTGRAVRTLVASSMKRGAYSVTWDGRDGRHRSLADGVYFLKFSAGDYRRTEKLVLQK